MRPVIIILSALAAVMILSSAPALAATCNIRGTVTDAAGNPVQGASVTIFDSNRAEVSTTVTDAAGSFSFTGLRVNTDWFTVRVFYNDYQRTYTNPSYFFKWYPANGDQSISSSDTQLASLHVSPSPGTSGGAAPGMGLPAAVVAVLAAGRLIGRLKK